MHLMQGSKSYILDFIDEEICDVMQKENKFSKHMV